MKTELKKASPFGRIFSRLRRYFLAGILVTAPVSITIYLTWIFLKFIDTKVSSIIPAQYYPQNAVPGLGVMIAVVFFIMVGWLARNVIGRLIIKASEFILDRVPVINTIYNATKQVFETVMGSKSQAFREVVMFEYPRAGVWTMGFVMGPALEEVTRIGGDELINVFLPTTPSPTNGILLFIPKKELRYMDLNVEEAFKLVLSGGILTPQSNGKQGAGANGKT